MAYIGRSVDIGMFEKQVLTPDSTTTSFALTFAVGSSNSLLIVYGGVIQEPGVAYSVSGGGQTIVFSEAPATGTTLYVIYMGKQLTTPRAAGQETTKQTFSGDGTTTVFTLTDPPVVPAGIMVFVDGILQREGAGNNYVSSGSTIAFTAAPDASAEIDVYTLVKEKVSIDTVADGSITVAKLAASHPTWNAAGNFDVSGSLTLSGTGKRIIGDMGSATLSNRLYFQSSIANSTTSLGVIPTGTGTSGRVNVFNNSVPDNASYCQLAVTATDAYVLSAATGTGAVLPFSVNVGGQRYQIATTGESIWSIGSEQMRLTSTGLGIGTSSPSYKLHVTNAGAVIAEVQNTSSTADARVRARNTQSYLEMGQDGTGGYLQQSGAYPLIFYVNASERMRITSTGDVGIGTSTVNNRLSVGDAGGVTVRLRDNNTGVFSLIESNSAGSLGFSADHGNNGPTASNINFSVDGTERARIDSSGNLLVGETSGLSSSGKIQVKNTATSNAVISLDATNASYAYTLAYLNTTRGASTAFNFIQCRTDAYTNTQFQVTGNGVIYAQNTTVQSLSDVRVKENVRDSDEGLQVILGVKTRRFDFKDGFGNDRKNVLGFIAQEMEEVFPDAVSELPIDPDGEGPEEPYKSVGPAALIPVLVKAIQEQQAMIQQLQADIAELKAK